MSRFVLLTLSIIAVMCVSAEAQKKGRKRNRNVGITTLAGHAAVHKELKLSDKQVVAIAEAVAVARKGFQASRKLKGEERRKKGRDVNRKLRATIAETLNDDQRKRFLQIEIQWSSGSWIVGRQEVAKMLELTREQRVNIRKISQDMQQSVQKLRASTTDDNRQEIQRKVNTVLAKAREAALKVLSDEQRAKWKKVRGETFELPRRNRKKKQN